MNSPLMAHSRETTYVVVGKLHKGASARLVRMGDQSPTPCSSVLSVSGQKVEKVFVAGAVVLVVLLKVAVKSTLGRIGQYAEGVLD